MRKGDFGAAALVAALMAVAMVLVAWRYGLPVRDPDGVAIPTWLRLPVIVLAAVALDVLARWLLLRRHGGPGSGPAPSFLGVVRDRWHREQVLFTASGLAAWYVAYAAFRNLKSYVPFVNDRLWDADLARIDRFLWLGHDPAGVLHHLLGTGWAAYVLAAVYVVWIGLVPATLAIALVWTQRSSAGVWFVTAVSLDWLLGVAVYYAVPTLGPIYSSPGDFDALPQTYNTTIQDMLLTNRTEVLADPFATTAVQTIAAFASLHVAVMMTICLIAELIRLPLWIRLSAWVFGALTVVSTVYLGWHFFVDVLGGIAVGTAAVAIAALATGNRLRRRDYTRSSTAERSNIPYSDASPSA